MIIIWNYTLDKNSRTSDKLFDWLDENNLHGEILFSNKIDVMYIEKIVIKSIPEYLIKMLSEMDPNIYEKVFDYSKVDEKYHKFIEIVY